MIDIFKRFIPVLILTTIGGFIQSYELDNGYIQVPGLLDLRTDVSDGAHSLEYLIKLAKKRGFNVLFINDHDLMVLEYGIRPLQNILKKRIERPSIIKRGVENYLNKIKSASEKNQDMIIIPGAESSPFYYWKGTFLKRNLTICDYERHLLTIGLENPEDYKYSMGIK